MPAYYNEIEPYAAQWLRNLISAGLIAAGDVDERSIVDVKPDDLKGYGQAHFFAGIGGWSIALRQAGWPDDRPVWTGSCPCQPFSAAGKGKAGDDERHLWPAWFSLIRECRPRTVFGEQVEAAVGWGWLDLVFDDLEKEGYACGAAVLPACSVGAPHIRQRLWFVADSDCRYAERRSRQRSRLCEQEAAEGTDDHARGRGEIGESGHADEPRLQGRGLDTGEHAHQRAFGAAGISGGMADADGGDSGAEGIQRGGEQRCQPKDGGVGQLALPEGKQLYRSGNKGNGRGEPANGGSTSALGYSPSEQVGRAGQPWQDCAWLPCTDGKARPVESSIFPLAHGIPARVAKLRAAGNAIVPQVAAEFIGAFLDVE